MEYQNPKIPEGINVTDEHPLKDFLFMGLGVSIFVTFSLVILIVLAERLVQFIPFEAELNLAESISAWSTSQDKDNKIEHYLQNLADELAEAQQLPPEMKISIRFFDVDEVNAFATLGGNIVIFRGLLEKMPHENALAMVMAHEIAHIKHRDPIVALGRGVAVSLAVMSIIGLGDGHVAQELIGDVSLLASLSFSRQQEQAADKEALTTLRNYYGHVQGAEEVFKVFMLQEQGNHTPEFLRTHPLSEQRLEVVESFSQQLQAEKVLLKKLPDWILLPNK